MLDCLAEWMSAPAYYWLYGERKLERAGMRHNIIVPYGPYRVRDGAVNLAVQNEGQWARFCRDVCRHPEWEPDPRYATSALRRVNRASLEAAVEEAFADLSRAEVTRRLEAADIPYADVNDVAAFVAHPQLAARDRWRAVDSPAGPLRAIVPPFDLEGMPPRMDPIPDVGEHTNAILSELGYDEEEISALREQGAV